MAKLKRKDLESLVSAWLFAAQNNQKHLFTKLRELAINGKANLVTRLQVIKLMEEQGVDEIDPWEATEDEINKHYRLLDFFSNKSLNDSCKGCCLYIM